MALPTLLDIVKRNGADAVVGLVEEAQQACPEVKMGAARTIKGISYKTLVRVALGNTSGSFRDANAGTSSIRHTYENRTFETFIMEPRIECDKAVADAAEDGPQAFIAEQASGVLQGELQALGKQFFYGRGTGGNAKGHPGLIQMHDTANMVVDATGTTDDVSTSVWMVRWGPQGVQWIWGLNGSLTFSPVRIESLVDPADAAKKLDGYVQTMLARPGLQVGSLQAVVRIKKITTDNGKGLTDKLINQALAKFPTGIQPDVVFMSRRSLQQLQDSRTATNPTGAPAPFPQYISGIAGQNIPIAVTDSISNTEKLAL